MNLIDTILNLAGLFLWIDWRSGRVARRPQTTISLANAARPAERGRGSGHGSLGLLILILAVRPCFYYTIGAKLNWTPQLDLLALSLPWRSDMLDRMYLYSTATFSLTLGFFYGAMLLLNVIHRAAPDAEVMPHFIRLQLGWLGKLPWPLKLALPSLLAAAAWATALPLLAYIQLLPGIPPAGAIWGQATAFALAALLGWKWLLIALFGLHFLNLYIYLGAHPLWAFVSQTARIVLRPLSFMTFPKLDLAPLAGAAAVWLLSNGVLRPAVVQLYQKFSS